MTKLMLAKEVIAAIKEEMLKEVKELKSKVIEPKLAIVRVGSSPDDLAYERGVIKRCESVAIKCKVFEYPEDIKQEDLINEIKELNYNNKIHGILIFRPLPKQIDENVIKYIISDRKDVDCFSPVNLEKVFEGDRTGFPPCTAEAVVRMLDYYGVELKGKNVTIIGRSLVVGRPLAMMLLKRDATVTICHRHTQNLQARCREADIIVVAVGRARMINEEFISKGQIVIDVGINLDEEGKLCGDVDFEKVKSLTSMITPVPGGVGAVTSSILAQHVIKAAKNAAVY